MDRRTLLASLGTTIATGLAGCGEGGPVTDPTESPTNTPTPTPTDRFGRSIALAAVDDVPEDVPVDYEVGVADDSVTVDGTAGITVAVTNNGDEEMDLRSPYYKGAPVGGEGVLLYSTEAPDGPGGSYAPECVDTASASEETLEWTDEGPTAYTLSPGESGDDTLLLVDDPTADGCLPPGEYRFEADRTVDGVNFTWGFTLAVEDGALDDEHTRYEECSREVIPYDMFPSDVQAEIDAALEGSYAADRVYLRETMDVDESYVEVDEEFYDPAVHVENDQEVLELAQIQPKALPNPRAVVVEHSRDGERTITVEVATEDGETLFETTRDQYAGGEVEYGETRLYGTVEIHVTVEDGDQVEDEFSDTVTINESLFTVIVVIHEDGVHLTGVVADLVYCDYEE